MLMTREDMSRDQSFNALAEAIVDRDQPRTTDADDGESPIASERAGQVQKRKKEQKPKR